MTKWPDQQNAILRDVSKNDLPVFFENQKDPEACYMAAFTAKNPSDQYAFDTFWKRILDDKSIIVKTILFKNQIAGSVLKYERNSLAEISYWIGKQFWGKGIATCALKLFLLKLIDLPVYARSAKDNIASLKVLDKCGFVITRETTGFANARKKEIEEYELILQ